MKRFSKIIFLLVTTLLISTSAFAKEVKSYQVETKRFITYYKMLNKVCIMTANLKIKLGENIDCNSINKKLIISEYKENRAFYNKDEVVGALIKKYVSKTISLLDGLTPGDERVYQYEQRQQRASTELNDLFAEITLELALI
jgi:hypothetical protein